MGAMGLRVLCRVPVLAMLLGPPCSSLTSALVPGRVAGRGCEESSREGKGLHPHAPGPWLPGGRGLCSDWACPLLPPSGQLWAPAGLGRGNLGLGFSLNEICRCDFLSCYISIRLDAAPL